MERVLEHMGGLYTFDDIMRKIADNTMQSFSHGNTWAVTAVCDYPRRRVVDILFVVGDAADLGFLHDTIVEFASRINATLVRAHGRAGWSRFVETNGWKIVDTVYYKDL